MRGQPLDLERNREALLAVLRGVIADPQLSDRALRRLRREHLNAQRQFFSADDLVAAYRTFTEMGDLPPFDPSILDRLRLKPIRTASGVTPLTVFTKPYPCPGECIFCPNDVRMPKSYLRDEPGAQRAEANAFDPYLQTYLRLQAFQNTGHPLDKIEVIILGGTWSFYPETYQRWFVKRVFDALHDFGRGENHVVETRAALASVSQLLTPLAESTLPNSEQRTYNQTVQAIYEREMRRSRLLEDPLTPRTVATEWATWEEVAAAQRENETAACRCVGLVIETRPDYTTSQEVIRLRRLGCTKVQLGFQSLDDHVLKLNRRGHTIQAIRESVKLFRQAGFKIHAHWMPNLFGATPASDLADYERLFTDPDFRPDELKIYPCSLIESADLMREYERGAWQPYSTPVLTELVTECLARTPEYCRLTRVIRDIPGTDIVDGNRVTNLRQVAELYLKKQGRTLHDIRAREIGAQQVDPATLQLDEQRYASSAGEEVFLQWITPARQIAGFLRLLLPAAPSFIEELGQAAVIREVHVYGQQIGIGAHERGKAQHSGLGTQLLERAATLARKAGFTELAVISAVGTREYYRKRGFIDHNLYQIRRLTEGESIT
jgi:elongator complex protein 3